MESRVIAHIDMDAFFAAVEQRDDPSLKGKPVIVGADPEGGKGRGVVATCSYEARKYGIHSAMPISQAYKRCPRAVYLRGSGRKYSRVSKDIFQILENFTPDIEPVSIDEAFMDLTGCYHFYQTPTNTCLKIKQEIKEKVKLTASIGIAPIKMVAKIASDYCKPDGLLEIKEGKVLDFLWPLPIEKLWGVGQKTQVALNAIGIKTIGDIARAKYEDFCERFGEHGSHLHDLANGIDPRVVDDTDDVKSVSNEHTFDRDTSDKEEIYGTLMYLSEKVSRRLRKLDLKGRTLTVKIRLKGFKTYTRAYTFPERTNFAGVIFKKAKDLFKEFAGPQYQIRLLGVKISNFENPYVKDSLFFEDETKKTEQVHQALDKIKDRFGERSIHLGS